MSNALVRNGEVVEAIQSSIIHGKHYLNNMPELIKAALEGAMWRERVIPQTGEVVKFDRFEQFVAAPPLSGLGVDIDMVKRICRDDTEALDLLDQATLHQGLRSDLHNNVMEVKVQGNSEEYALRRLRKHAPELHQKVIAGEMSPHAAMITAGFRKQTLTIPVDPQRAARIIARHFPPEQLQHLLMALQEQASK